MLESGSNFPSNKGLMVEACPFSGSELISVSKRQRTDEEEDEDEVLSDIFANYGMFCQSVYVHGA